MTVQTSRSEGRRRAILRAALAVFLEHGVEGASIEEIRRRSGASIGSIYHHFESKQGIAAALYLDALTNYQQQVIDALASHRSAQAGVKAVVAAHLDWIQSDTDRARYLFMDRGAEVREVAKQPLRALNANLSKGVMSWLQPKIEDGEIRDLPFEVLFALWVGPAQELSRNWLSRRRPPAIDVTDVLAESAWMSLSAGTRR